jgi:hypothetical protein
MDVSMLSSDTQIIGEGLRRNLQEVAVFSVLLILKCIYNKC